MVDSFVFKFRGRVVPRRWQGNFSKNLMEKSSQFGDANVIKI